MLRTLLIKLAMLAAAVALVFWIGWPMPEEPGPDNEGDEPPSLVPPRTPAASPPDIRTSTIQPGGTAGTDAGPAASRTRLDLNRATADDLERLPGIGAVLAQRIVEWRQGHGPFTRVEELNNVKGIGEKKLAQLAPLVTVGQPGQPRTSSVRPGAGSRTPSQAAR
ncbi:MAG: helix-hairpin-helix domain-containing protein [Nitrospirota bacterium]|nr:helix-hairpin-helix domain-containing protein [Nitrospirota bacterium]